MSSENLGKKVEALEASLKALTGKSDEPESEVRKLHHKYGYYLDKCLYNEVVDLFSTRPDAYMQFLNGRFHGKESIRRIYCGRFGKTFVAGRNGPVDGFLLDHLMAQDVVDYQPATNTVKLRGRTFMSAGTHETLPKNFPGGYRQWWEGGVYENEYVEEDGVWKILRLRYYPFWHGRFTEGWQHCSEYVPLFTQTYPIVENGPDELIENFRLWPDTRVVPFHYPHPITGKDVAEDDMKAPKYREAASSAPAARVIDDWIA